MVMIIADKRYKVQDMPSLYFALLNKAMAVEECDARNDAMKYKRWVSTGFYEQKFLNGFE
jgi:hypothetical protein